MKNMYCIYFLFFFIQTQIFSQPQLDLEFVASGFAQPVGIACAGDERLFIVERFGTISILHPDGSNSLFLDITDRVHADFGEQGLLGLVFHPDYASNGYFFVNYINDDDDTRISRFNVSATDSNLADASSEFNILAIDQPAVNHNGGDLHFGPEGYLYCALGNGGGTANENAQDTTNLLGKILRIDVDAAAPYVAPDDNPFVGMAGKDELWNFGLRNPWRFSFDRLTGDMYIADVGAAESEEINFQPAFSTGGENYGWRCYEGTIMDNPDLCLDDYPLTFPVFEYPHDPFTGGFAVSGGFVYRGNDYPGMQGHYIFCDYVSGNFWSMQHVAADSFVSTFHGMIRDDIPAFGENMNGELFACDKVAGSIYKVVDLCSSVSLSFAVTNASASTINNGAIDLAIAGGTAPYMVNWSNGATTEDISSLAAGTYTVTVTDAAGCSANGGSTVLNNCGAATGVVVSGITSTTATISWNDVGAANYRVLYFKVGSPASSVLTTSISVTLTGLSPSSNYVFKIRNKCPGAPGNFITNGSFMTSSMKESLAENDIFIYPNPNSGSFKVSGSEGIETITIMDVTGNILYEESPVREYIRFEGFENGFYIILLELKGGEILKNKVVIVN